MNMHTGDRSSHPSLIGRGGFLFLLGCEAMSLTALLIVPCILAMSSTWSAGKACHSYLHAVAIVSREDDSAERAAQPGESGHPNRSRDEVTTPGAPAVAEPAEIAPASRPEIRFIRNGPVRFSMDVSLSPDHPEVISGTAVPEAMHDHLRVVLQKELDRYPKGFAATAVGTVIIGDTISRNDRQVSGLSCAGIVFIAARLDRSEEEARDAYLVRTLHHEFAHQLKNFSESLFGVRFDEAPFRETLPPGFVYLEERPGARAGEALDTMVNVVGSVDDLADGFIAQYARANIAEDFCSYAEVLMSRPGVLDATFAPDSRVFRKARLVREFYIALDPRFKTILATPGP